MKKKNQKRKLYQTKGNQDLEYIKVIKIVIIVIIFLVLTYFIAALITGELQFGKKEQEQKEEVAIQYEEIMAGQVFNRPNSEYWVLFFPFTDTFASYYLQQKDIYTSNPENLAVYIVDLEKSFNKNLVLAEDEKYQQNPTKISDLKVSNPTLLRIRDHKVAERITGREEILKFFKEDSESE